VRMKTEPARDRTRPVPVVIVALVGASIGFVIWMTADMFVFFPVFLAIGVTMGMVLGQRQPGRD